MRDKGKAKVNKVLNGIIASTRCFVCGREYDRVCNECLASGKPACFCDRHENNHKERMHEAYWGKLGE